MLHKRRSEIIEKVRMYRMVKVQDLMKEYNVSIETIRRDLEYLENEGYLKRVYGGAVLPGFYGQEPDFTHREIVNYEEKIAIGTKTATMINDGDTLMMDVGTTVLEVANCLRDKKNLTVITNSTLIASKMATYNDCRVILLGGDLRPGELSVSGILAEQNLDRYYANKMIMGVGGITLANGITDYHSGEASVRRKMLDRSERVIAVADCCKFGVTALNAICPISRLSGIVTDWTLPHETIKEYKDGGITLTISDNNQDKEQS